MPQRFDNGSLEEAQRTPQGGLRVPAFLTRTGIFEYQRLDGTVIREYRSPEEVFSPASLASLASAPVTLKHPSKMVVPKNFKIHVAGNVHGDPRRDGDKISADLMIQDQGAIDAVEIGKTREISCGYRCDVDDTPGVTPEGERYDRKQIGIVYNHVALVPKGRAGRDVRLRLDADDNQLMGDPMTTKPKVKPMKQVRIDGIDYEVGSDSCMQAINRFTAQKLAEHEAATKRADEEKARADMAEKTVKELQEKLDAATSPEAVTKKVNARADLLSKAREVLGKEEKLDELSDHEIRVKALEKLDSEIKLDEESEDYVKVAFTYATKNLMKQDSADADSDADKARRDAAVATAGIKDKPGKKPVERSSKEARLDMKASNEAEWQKPLTTSTRSQS